MYFVANDKSLDNTLLALDSLCTAYCARDVRYSEIRKDNIVMAETVEYRVSVYLSPIQQEGVELGLDRTHEGMKTLTVQERVNSTGLMSALKERLGEMLVEQDGVNYIVSLRRIGDYPSGMTDLGTVFFAETLQVSQHYYAEDLKQIAAEILGVSPA